jgi:AcrR family transcriptional regulator
LPLLNRSVRRRYCSWLSAVHAFVRAWQRLTIPCAEPPAVMPRLEEIAELAGISRGLLYHYFPTKRDFYVAVSRAAAAESGELTAPDRFLPASERLRAGIDAFVRYAEEHSQGFLTAYRGSLAGDPEVRAIVEEGRQRQAARILETVASDAEPAPLLRLAVHGWICLRSKHHREMAAGAGCDTRGGVRAVVRRAFRCDRGRDRGRSETLAQSCRVTDQPPGGATWALPRAWRRGPHRSPGRPRSVREPKGMDQPAGAYRRQGWIG